MFEPQIGLGDLIPIESSVKLLFLKEIPIISTSRIYFRPIENTLQEPMVNFGDTHSSE